MAGWNSDTLAGSTGAGAVTIVQETSFCVSDEAGDIHPDRPHGFFFQDTRLLSSWSLRLNGRAVEGLSAAAPQHYRAVFLARSGHVAGRADTPLVIERERHVGDGLREDVRVRNYSREPVEFSIEFLLDVDFADIFEVKDGHPRRKWGHTQTPGDGELLVEARWEQENRGVRFIAPGAEIDEGALTFRRRLDVGEQCVVSVVLAPIIEGRQIPVTFPIDRPLRDSGPEQRFVEWRSDTPNVSLANAGIEQVLRTSQRDLGALRIFDDEHPDRAVVAAGAPWFMALFGRDSLLTSLMALPVDPSLALGTLQTLADRQGQEVNLQTEEQPGRILHEVRLGLDIGLALGGGSVYYGTVDATPLFVVALGELSKWGVPLERLSPLLANADNALRWIDDYGDRDGDGFVEYERLNDRGLVNQGWKDSWDGINFADGQLAEPPIALCEVQGYVYSAFCARALLANELGEPDQEKYWRGRAERLKDQFNERFWMPDRGYFAVALDKDKRQVDACASNMGHALWSGIVDDDKAGAVAGRLMAPEMFSGWGIRTLATDMGAYNPVSYHNGSVWPHDNALIAAGLMRYRFTNEARTLADALLEAAQRFGGRLPELFCGFDRESYQEPIPYPTACSPQAWAAATPISLLRTLLGFNPCLPRGEVWLDPALPEGFGRVWVENVPLDDVRVSVYVDGDKVRIDGLPEGVRLRSVSDSVPGSSFVDLFG